MLQGCTANVESARAERELLRPVVAQRVTGTVQREASRLVRLETERETLLTTPEHPFAAPGSGWIRAGRLVPGSWVVSERLGAVWLRSVRSEPVARPVPVFNLSVASSHAYFVGIDRVLVHNTKCKTAAFEAREATIERLVREREELNREIDALKQTAPASPRLAELKLERDRVQKKINSLRQMQRIALDVVPANRDELAWQRYQAEHEAARKGIEDAQREMAEIESRTPRSETGDLEVITLERRIAALQTSYERTGRILNLLRELAELAEATAATVADRAVLEGRKKALRVQLRRERKREADLNNIRRKRAVPGGLAEALEYNRKLRHRLRRTSAYLADEERPRDRLEIAEDELGRWLQAAPSESRAAQIRHLTDQIDTMKKLVQSRKEYERLRRKRASARRRRKELLAIGADTRRLDAQLEQAERAALALRAERAQLRVRERLLAQVDGAPSADARGAAGEARLHELERQLAGGVGSEQQLAGIERALDAMDPAHADLQEAVQDEADDVDETLSEREVLM